MNYVGYLIDIDNFHERSLASFWNETEFWFKFFPKYEELAKLVRLARLSLASPDPFLSPADLLSESDVMATESSKLSEVLSKLEFMNNKKSITNPAGFKEISDQSLLSNGLTRYDVDFCIFTSACPFQLHF